MVKYHIRALEFPFAPRSPPTLKMSNSLLPPITEQQARSLDEKLQQGDLGSSEEQLLTGAGKEQLEALFVQGGKWGLARLLSLLLAPPHSLDINARGDHKQTALIAAAYNGHEACVQRLVAAGAGSTCKPARETLL